MTDHEDLYWKCSKCGLQNLYDIDVCIQCDGRRYHTDLPYRTATQRSLIDGIHPGTTIDLKGKPAAVVSHSRGDSVEAIVLNTDDGKRLAQLIDQGKVGIGISGKIVKRNGNVIEKMEFTGASFIVNKDGD